MVSVGVSFLGLFQGFLIFLFGDFLAGEEPPFFFLFVYFVFFLLGLAGSVLGLLLLFFGHVFSPFAPLFSAK